MASTNTRASPPMPDTSCASATVSDVLVSTVGCTSPATCSDRHLRHSSNVVAPLFGWWVPAGHGVQLAKPVDGPYVPGPHVLQFRSDDAPATRDAVPTGQNTHAVPDVAPNKSEYVPGPHGMQDARESPPMLAATVPTGHGKAVLESAGQYMPARPSSREVSPMAVARTTARPPHLERILHTQLHRANGRPLALASSTPWWAPRLRQRTSIQLLNDTGVPCRTR